MALSIRNKRAEALARQVARATGRHRRVREARRIGLMVIDSSALLAVLLDAPEAEAVARAIAREPRRLLSAFVPWRPRS